jgi:tetratricopeptide (TPR) repeat protein
MDAVFLQHREAIAYLLLPLAVFAIYANVYPYDFLLDDQSLIITNLFLRDWHHLPDIFTHLNYAGSGAEKGFYRPVEQVLRLALYQMFGLSRPAFHALNVVIHAINAALMYRLGRKLGFMQSAAFSAALLWAVHPIYTQEVAYMSSTSELLWAMFCLLGLSALLPDFTPRKTGVALLLFLLALISKETAVVFPALASACLFIVSKDRLKPSLYIKTWPFWLLSVLYTVTYMHVNSYRPFAATSPDMDTYAQHIIPRIFTALATLPVYFGLVIYPTNLHMERYFPVFLSFFSWQVVAGAGLAIAALAQILVGKGKRGLALTFGFFWFAAALSPVTGILIPVDALISEGWLYVPAIGLFLGVAQTLAVWVSGLKFRRAPAIAAVAVTLASLSLGVETYFQNEVYQNPATFYDNIFKCGGYRSRAYPDLGIYYMNKHDFDNSIKYFKLAVENPNERNVPSAAIHAQLALAYLRVTSDENYMVTPDAVIRALPSSTQIPEAIDELNLALRIDPNFYFAHTLLSAIYRWQGDTANADFHYRQMLGILRTMGRVK